MSRPWPYVPTPRLTDAEGRAIETRAAACTAHMDALDAAELAANRGVPVPDNEVVWDDDPARTERPEADRHEGPEAARLGTHAGHDA